ncbi:DUF3231 family protein [Desulfallas thermosapovorans]|uniref:Uncharacterized protein DUF3231 n=1 Tax=Desulfallas thermosapovorans DSM 6562 TaxID=1121431 RepID=A0A5S4ZRP1_9FIRM|nr:DUF3231 family protein [Desulfallas thermosapovorans]TYO95310.1 uncharacterized protein DUF3231 [Desulfallas thermosapovorans DSM 6562]
MVQIGNFHIGKAETAQQPALDNGEAFLLWDMLVSRYDIIEITQIYQNFGHDPDFKILLQRGLTKTLEKEVDIMEKELNRYRIPLPNRPPKSVRIPAGTGILEDRFMFKQIFTGIQAFLDNHVKTIRSIITNDALRDIMINFAKDELDIFNDMCKYGKLKGWLEVPPQFTPNSH